MTNPILHMKFARGKEFLQLKKYVDNKRQKIEKSPSAAQREKVFMDMTKNEITMKYNLAKEKKESNSTLKDCVNAISTSTLAFG